MVSKTKSAAGLSPRESKLLFFLGSSDSPFAIDFSTLQYPSPLPPPPPPPQAAAMVSLVLLHPHAVVSLQAFIASNKHTTVFLVRAQAKTDLGDVKVLKQLNDSVDPTSVSPGSCLGSSGDVDEN
ncbi:hypothetical protein CDL15_Pgr010573 [Punica granatum]|uniref:Uncharacterized protein n=1 Tax=Punica granatum TaxID=22663 RepID=A0A218WWS3_PUNGR|nr:hypothetical protein CDL15_Pgr010573 [Punica granatum]